MFQVVSNWRTDRYFSELFKNPLWKRSARAYKSYCREPNDDRFRRVFEELLNRNDVWLGQQTGTALFREFDLAAPTEPVQAQRIASRIIGRLRNPVEAGSLRLVLAARAMLAHGDACLVASILRNELTGEKVYEADVQRLLLTMRSANVGASDSQLVEKLVREHGLSFLAKEWIRHRWLYDKASPDLLEFASNPSIHSGHDRPHILNDALALAFLLNDGSSVSRLIATHPELEGCYEYVLPLAPYLASRSISPTFSNERARIFEFADLYRAIEFGSKQLVNTIREPSLTIGIVGNSPCELGLGRGSLIDQHDIVVRFNLFSTSDEFASDYGKKCTIHVRRPGPEEYNSLSCKVGLTLLNWADLPYRLRNFTAPMQLFRQGAKLAGFPTGFHQALYKELKTQPSAGLVFVSFVKSVRGMVPRNSCFGFSFVDQIADTSAHYFQDARPSFRHRWGEELSLFQRMTTNH